MPPLPEPHSQHAPAKELDSTVSEQILRDKFIDFARQIKLAKAAELFIVPIVGDFAPQRTSTDILAACEMHGCRTSERQHADGIVGERKPARVDGRPQLSWEYVWDGSGRLVELIGKPLLINGKINTAGASKEYEFSYADDGKLESAVIRNYSLESGEPDLLTRVAVNLRMDQKSRSLPQDLTLASFFCNTPQKHVSGLLVPGGMLVDLTRLGSADAEHPARPAERVAELSGTIPFIEKQLRTPTLFDVPRGEILYTELARQLTGAKIELRDMRGAMARDSLDLVFLLNDTFSTKVGDIFCDQDLSPREKRARISQFGSEVTRSLATAGDHSIKEECERLLRAVRAANELLSE